MFFCEKIERNCFEKWKSYLNEKKHLKYLSLLSKSNKSSFIMDENSLDLSNKWHSNSVLYHKDLNENEINFSFEK